ncbi:Got1/Sft2-like family-domain-containing protein [Xylariales sp. PMI_506]|nr:Got1/Sft2-like family-domain-containing protein [Xylariales sp. PMI_506]
MASSSFRESMNSLGWSRRNDDMPVNTSQTSGLLSSIKSLNPFGDRGYVQLPITEGPGAPLPASTRREEEEGWLAYPTPKKKKNPPCSDSPEVGHTDIVSMCEVLTPRAATTHTSCPSTPQGQLQTPCFLFKLTEDLDLAYHTKPRKFAILWSFGSVLFLCSWAAMMGPMVYVRHLLSGNRLPFTAAYFGSIFMTLYFSLGLRSTILTLISAIVQLACLLWYLISYFPMGSSGLRLATTFGARRAAAWMSG